MQPQHCGAADSHKSLVLSQGCLLPLTCAVGLLQTLVETVLKSLLLSVESDRTNPVTGLKYIDNVNTSYLHYRYGCVFRSQWHHFCLE